VSIGFTEEHEFLRGEIERFLRERAPLERVRQIARTPAGYAPELWAEMAELGWTGLLIPEEHGGAGLDWAHAAVLLESTGRGLLPSPLLSTLLASWAIRERGSAAQQQHWLPRLARGRSIATLALFESLQCFGSADVQTRARRESDGSYRLSGDKTFVHDVGSADLFVVAAQSEAGMLLALVERGASGVEARPHPTLDATKRMGTLHLDEARVEPGALLSAPPQARAHLARILDAAAVGCAAEMVGAAAAALALTVDYAKQREQFGQPIGRFQGVKHPLAEMYVDVETARSLVTDAAWALDGAPAELPRAAAMAKAYATEAFARVGLETIQLHGAIGYTAEYDAQLYYKRSKWARPAFGDASHHYERVAELGGLTWISS
jgi:alkylation response protein AidB-like acyl-CoA dehydrogenase